MAGPILFSCEALIRGIGMFVCSGCCTWGKRRGVFQSKHVVLAPQVLIMSAKCLSRHGKGGAPWRMGADERVPRRLSRS